MLSNVNRVIGNILIAVWNQTPDSHVSPHGVHESCNAM